MGILSRVEISDYTECVDKAFHHDRRQTWFAHVTEMRQLEQDQPREADQSLIERRGKIDLEKLVQRNNTSNTVETSMTYLYDYLKKELLIAQDQKDIESARKEAKKAEGFFQEEDSSSVFYGQTGARGGRGRGQQAQRGFTGRGGARGGQRQQNTGQRRPVKYPVDQKALTKAISRLKPGQNNPPQIADCPIGCHHSLPYGTAELCEEFEKKDLSMKQDTVKKSNYRHSGH